MTRWRVQLSAALACLVVLGACSPAATPGLSAPAQSPGQTSAPAAPKVLTMGILQEPTDFYGFGGSTAFGGVVNVPPIALDTLVVANDTGQFQPLLAAEQISVERGTWRLNPDGTMDTTWKLKPNVKWHDGAPFSADDLLFTIAVRKDPETAIRNFGRLDLLQSATAPDPLTLVLRWSAPYAEADQALDLEPLPKHLLEEVHQNDKANFLKSPYLSTQFVGQGPYRLQEWQSGSQMIFTRFDDYHQGRPPLDRVVVRFLGDPNTMLANILSDAVDILLPDGIGLDAAAEVQQRWAGTGNQVRFDLLESPWQLEIQRRPEVARPTGGLTNLTVRQALYHAIDRKTLAEVATHGLAPVADSWVPPTSGLRPALESSIPQYPFDPARAAQLLAEAGWTRGSDGTLANSTGDRFETELWVNQGADAERITSVVGSQWRDVGAQVGQNVIPPARSSDREYGASYPGAHVNASPSATFLGDRFRTSQIRSAANRFAAQNRAGYSNPTVDTLLDQVAVTVDRSQRTTLLGQLVQAQMRDLAVMPLFWVVRPVLQVKGVKSHPAMTSMTTWNFFEFDKV
jgi:peptide/nickel transport system substrate-binding protein